MSDFAPEPHLILSAFDAVMANVSVASATLMAMRADCVAAFQSGEPRDQARWVHKHLEAVDWQWPWLDNTRDRCATAGVWPYLWKAHARSKPTDVAIRKEMRLLLVYTLGATVYAHRDFAQRLPGWNYRLSSMPPDDGIPGWPEAAARFQPERRDTWPPYFPGDRTSVIGERRRRS